MLQDLKDLQGYAVRATDGDVGTVSDFYFDDDRWVVRYLVVETGSWLSSRKVLISPVSLGAPDHEAKCVPVAITREQVSESPDIDTDKPVSRQHEADFLGYYGYPVYWDNAGIWGAGTMPGMLVPEAGLVPSGMGTLDGDGAIAAEITARHQDEDPHLRACREVVGYHIKAQDGEIGHVAGWIVDEQSWQIRYLAVDTSNWWMGHKVLVSPQWIKDVSWSDREVAVGMTQTAVRNAPPWDPKSPPDRIQEADIYRHYDRTGYW